MSFMELDHSLLLRRSSRGFTLIETLVALVLASLVLLMLSTMSSQFGGTANRVRLESSRIEAMNALSRTLRLVLKNVSIEMIGASEFNILGDLRQVEVSTLGPPLLGLTRETRFVVRFQPSSSNGGPGRVLLSWNDPDDRKSHEEEITSNIASFELEYKGSEPGSAWQNEWHRPASFLRLIQFTAILGDKSSRILFRDVISFRPVLPQTCVINPFFEGCPSW